MTDQAAPKGSTKKCGLAELFVFLVAIVCGTACSICSKTMMQLHSVGMTGERELFDKPLFQTWAMFVVMLSALVAHVIVVRCRIPFPGYDHYGGGGRGGAGTNGRAEDKPLLKQTEGSDSKGGQKSSYGAVEGNQKSTSSDNSSIPTWMYFFLAIPSMFDIGATLLCMMGLVYLDTSIYQLLRGSGIIFVALMKQHVLGDHLYKFQWIGVFWNVVSVFLVGATAVLNTGGSSSADFAETLIGVGLVMAGALVQALQFVFEEKVMSLEDAAVAPLLLIGMEGFWGTLICMVVLYPLAYLIPGSDHGSWEHPYNTAVMFYNSNTVQIASCVYFFAILGYNVFAILVTYLLSSVWHAILDNFRPITVWGTNMFIFYVITEEFGESWMEFSWLQVLGLLVLLYGTAIYNAPNAGCIFLEGQWYAFWLNLKVEYQAIAAEEEQLKLHDMEADQVMDDDDWKQRMEEFKMRRPSSLAERSPHVSVHTQALRGLSSTKN